MKVYLSGSHCIGKSTLGRFVSEKYSLPMISETARMILSEQELQVDSLRADLTTANKYQVSVFERQILEESKYAEEFVSDRSLLDILAYTAQHTEMLPLLLKSKFLIPYIDSLKNEDVFLFFVRPSKVTMKEDGVREKLNWDGMVAIDAQIKFIIQMFGLKYFQISADSMQERTQLIDAVLSLRKNK